MLFLLVLVLVVVRTRDDALLEARCVGVAVVCCCCVGGGCKGKGLGIFLPVVVGAVIVVGVGDNVGFVGDNVYQLVGAKGK